MTPGERLKAAREKAGITQAQLAASLGFGPNYKGYVSDVERDRKVPSLDWLFRVAEALACSPSALDPRFAVAFPKKSRKKSG